MSDDNVVSITGGILHDNHLQDGKLFSVVDVISEAPLEECDEVLIICRTREGRLYIGGTHSTSVCSLLLGQATNFVHGAYEVYGSEE